MSQVLRSKFDDLNDDLAVSKRINTSKIFKRRVKDVIVSMIASQLRTQLN